MYLSGICAAFSLWNHKCYRTVVTSTDAYSIIFIYKNCFFGLASNFKICARVVDCRYSDACLICGSCVPTSTQHVIPPRSDNEYQWKLGSKRAHHAIRQMAPMLVLMQQCLAEDHLDLLGRARCTRLAMVRQPQSAKNYHADVMPPPLSPPSPSPSLLAVMSMIVKLSVLVTREAFCSNWWCGWFAEQMSTRWCQRRKSWMLTRPAVKWLCLPPQILQTPRDGLAAPLLNRTPWCIVEPLSCYQCHIKRPTRVN